MNAAICVGHVQTRQALDAIRDGLILLRSLAVLPTKGAEIAAALDQLPTFAMGKYPQVTQDGEYICDKLKSCSILLNKTWDCSTFVMFIVKNRNMTALQSNWAIQRFLSFWHQQLVTPTAYLNKNMGYGNNDQLFWTRDVSKKRWIALYKSYKDATFLTSKGNSKAVASQADIEAGKTSVLATQKKKCPSISAFHSLEFRTVQQRKILRVPPYRTAGFYI